MPDRPKPRFAVKTVKPEDVPDLPEREYSTGTYGAAADAVAELSTHLERVAAALREGRI